MRKTLKIERNENGKPSAIYWAPRSEAKRQIPNKRLMSQLESNDEIKEWRKTVEEFIEFVSDASNLNEETRYYFRQAHQRSEGSPEFYSLALKWKEEYNKQ